MTKFGVVGLGQQAREYIHILRTFPDIHLAAVCDTDAALARKMAADLGAENFSSLTKMAREVSLEAVLLCLPHNVYFGAIECLARPGVRFLKEKPFATSFEEAVRLDGLLRERSSHCSILLRRRFNPTYQFAATAVARLGEVYSAEFRYTLSVDRLDEGWRAHRSLAGGGAVIDMGYHLIDLIVWLLGIPDAVTARMSACARPDQFYDVEDTAHLLLDFEVGVRRSTPLSVNVLVSRTHGAKEEGVRIVGTEGVLTANPTVATLTRHDGSVLERQTNSLSTSKILANQLTNMLKKDVDLSEIGSSGQLAHHVIIEAAYASSASGRTVRTETLMERISDLEYA